MPDIIEEHQISQIMLRLRFALQPFGEWAPAEQRKLRQALSLAADWRDGTQAAGTSPSVSGGTTSRPTENAATKRPSREAQLFDTMTAAAKAIISNLATLEDCQAEIMHRPKDSDLPASASCNCCGRVIAQTDSDKKVSGYCSACYQAWRTYRKTNDDRPAFELARKATHT